MSLNRQNKERVDYPMGSVKKTDLRVIKTEQGIKSAFGELLQNKELDCITVTELAKKAQINKGTFYLHYTDIYDLFDNMLMDKIRELTNSISFFDEFFNDPRSFITHSLELSSSYMRPFCDPLVNPKNYKYLTSIPILMTNEFREKIYALKTLERTPENDIRLDFVLSCLFHFIHGSYSTEHTGIVIELLISSIESAFPEIKPLRTQE